MLESKQERPKLSLQTEQFFRQGTQNAVLAKWFNLNWSQQLNRRVSSETDHLKNFSSVIIDAWQTYLFQSFSCSLRTGFFFIHLEYKYTLKIFA